MGVKQFYEGKTIFITGATGFMGKVLVEKLLRSCPGIERIYILLRAKRGYGVEERLQQYLESDIFELLKKENPGALKKIVGIKGDVAELNLGLSEPDRNMLVENVNIIYHSAASVRFDDFLEKAILINVRAAREVSQLALDLKNPTLLVHISTAYSCGRQFVEEKLYPPITDWRDAIMLAEQCDKELLGAMTEKLIHPYPNTYTFAKGLGEHVVNDMCSGKIPAIITRPSIVVSTMDEPFKGWMDNFNGPFGLMTAVGKGLIRIVMARGDINLNYIPVDVSIKAIILASYNSAVKSNDNQIEVFNITEDIFDSTMEKFFKCSMILSVKSPFINILRCPKLVATSCIYNYYIQMLFFHTLPAFILDSLLKLLGKKPILVKLLRKTYIANTVLRHFTLNNYVFINDKTMTMQKNLKDDEQDFSYQQNLNIEEFLTYMSYGMKGISLYALKEPVHPKGDIELKQLRRLRYAETGLKTIFFCFVGWLLLVKFNLIEKLISIVDNYFQTL